MSFFNMMTKSFQSIKYFSTSNYRTVISHICFFVRWFCGKFLFINFSQFFNIFLKHLTPCQIVVKLLMFFTMSHILWVIRHDSYGMSHTARKQPLWSICLSSALWLVNPCSHLVHLIGQYGPSEILKRVTSSAPCASLICFNNAVTSSNNCEQFSTLHFIICLFRLKTSFLVQELEI